MAIDAIEKEGRAPEDNRPATYQDVLDAPPHKVAEIVASQTPPAENPASKAG
ncbi:MAG: hypothetical protein OXF66_08555 [Gammaproteobacteria bacterium]|nr:hypothetical protein [Gammaproteobacteria bacterium]